MRACRALPATWPVAARVPWALRSPCRRDGATSAAVASQQQPTPNGSTGSGSSGGGRSAATVEIDFRGRRLQAERGSTLRTALLEAGVTPHNGRASLINCRGLGTCGTCAVEVQGAVEPLEWTTQERLRLNFPPHGPPGNARLRLACQVACLADLAVVKRTQFWGQGEEVLPDLPGAEGATAGQAAGTAGAAGPAGAAVMPLGQLEFVLDRRRRQRKGQGQGQQ